MWCKDGPATRCPSSTASAFADNRRSRYSYDDSGVGEYVVKVVAPGVGWEDEIDLGLFDETDGPVDEFGDQWEEMGDSDDFGDLADGSGDPWDDFENTDHWEDPWDELDESGQSGDFWDESEDPWDGSDATGQWGDPWDALDESGQPGDFWDDQGDSWDEFEDAEGFWDESDDDYAWGAFDVNEDAIVSPLDVLGIIGYLNFPSEGRDAEPGSPREDVNSDGTVSPMDVLMVISHLNDPTSVADRSSSAERVDRSASQLTALAANAPSPLDVATTRNGSADNAPVPKTQDALRDTLHDDIDHSPRVSRHESDSGENRRVHRTSHHGDVDLLMEANADWLSELWGRSGSRVPFRRDG